MYNIYFSIPLYRTKSPYETYIENGFTHGSISQVMRSKYVGDSGDVVFKDYTLVSSMVQASNNFLDTAIFGHPTINRI